MAESLEEQRLTALEERAAARLELGEHAPLTAELAGLAARHPLRERLRVLQLTTSRPAGTYGVPVIPPSTRSSIPLT